jgi:putative flippase GtrA
VTDGDEPRGDGGTATRAEAPATGDTGLPDVLERYLGAVTDPKRFVAFGGVGGVGLVVDNAALFALVETTGAGATLLKPFSAAVAIAVMFALNERFTFEPRDRSATAVLRRYLKSNLVRAGGVLVALGVLFVLHDLFGLWYLAANVTGILVAFFINYAAESLFTWQVQRA